MKAERTIQPWWLWATVILFPIPFSPGWLGTIFLLAFILLVALLGRIKCSLCGGGSLDGCFRRAAHGIGKSACATLGERI